MSAVELTLIPRASEKTYAMAQTNTYVFNVPLSANKQQIAEAIAKQYDVTVKTVNIVIAKGKVKQTIRKGRPVEGKRRDIKKAYVALDKGSSIKIFEEEQ